MMIGQASHITEARDHSVGRYADIVLAKQEKCFAKSDEAVMQFLRTVIKDILSERRVRADIERRVRSGSGHQACKQSQQHCGDCEADYGTQLINAAVELASTDERLVNKIISQSTSTWLNVIARGARDNAGSMDAATAKFVRRQILTETIIREVVSEVRSKHQDQQTKKSKDGFLFALPQTLKEKFSDQVGRFEEATSRIPPFVMSDIMNKGNGVVPEFASDLNNVWRELERIDAMGLLEPGLSNSYAAWWTTLGTLSENRPPYNATASVCENLSYIPFELNAKHKGLMVQVVDNFQLMLLESDKGHIDFPSTVDSVKFFCLVPFTQTHNTPIQVNVSDETINVSPGSLLIVDAKKCKLSLPKSSSKRFIVSVYLTGPS